MSKYLPSDRLLSYQPLFIKDVTTADIQNDEPLTLKTKHNLLFQKVKLNGLIVSKKDYHGAKLGNSPRCILCLDDSSDVILVHLSQRLFKRNDAFNLTMAASVTILGEPQQYNNTIIISCKGFQVESDPAVELCHSLQVISNHNDRTKAKKHASASVATSYVSNGRKRQKRSESNLFNSLSSQPSPIRGSVEDLYPSPTRNNANNNVDDVRSMSQVSKEAPWHWSPDHIAATSTPIRNSILSSPKYTRSSPLRFSQTTTLHHPSQQQQTLDHTAIITNNNKNNDNAFGVVDDDDDDFGFADDSQFDALDFDYLEKKALEGRAV
ncbi:hypothetical protein BCR42DRAFT_391622 [Absidia repens]|uniref:Uncharacterized protein n=1 Tax=Absidia repens TaxID=90262 RepID=A0A1X2IMA1_9FUNG|nr:hypothetical protein BCR42DRAFT_391622 [Absidia repens]